MPERHEIVPILRTKLYRPPIAQDLVERKELEARLEAARQQVLTLVSAPAGYGKTTLVSRFLELADTPSAWLSLDETDGDLRVFLSYFVAAVRTLFPEACPSLESLLEAVEMPSTRTVARQLIDDLEDIDSPFILALDDFQTIREPAVHDLLSELLSHPPTSVRLVVLCRHNPPLPLAALRASGQMVEIRMRDLQFTEQETLAFLISAAGRRPEQEIVKQLYRRSEGWPVALRLAALALRNRSDDEAFVRGFSGDSSQVQQYLVEEVLESLSPDQEERLCKISILERFCAPLCESVLEESSIGRELIENLNREGLLCVPLDAERDWNRYHHLFRELLLRRLNSRYSDVDVAALHKSAAQWFSDQGFLEEAMQHYLSAGDGHAAGRALAAYRKEITTQEQWYRLDRLLGWLPTEIVERDADLLILLALSSDKRGRYVEMAQALDRGAEMLERGDLEDIENRRRLGEIEAYQSMLLYHEANGPAALATAERALARLPEGYAAARADAVMIRATSLQMNGRYQEALEVLLEAMQRDGGRNPAFQGRLLFTLASVYWMAADLPSMQRTATVMLELTRDRDLPETVGYARYFQGAVHYHLNRLNEAEEVLRAAVSARFGPSTMMRMMQVYALSLVLQVKGEPDRARSLSDSLLEEMLGAANTSLLSYARALQADLAFRQGRRAEAFRWAREFEPRNLGAGYHFNEPELTVAKLLLAEGTEETLSAADRLLNELSEFFARTHNVRFQIEVFALQALLLEARGESEEATDRLVRSLEMAQPGGFIRLFTDLGPELNPMLGRVDLGEEGLHYVGQIMAAYRSVDEPATDSQTMVPSGSQPLIEPLTPRELEILGLLAERLTNKEIGERLFISPVTVKRHANNIYEKLAVHGRREAVSKAFGLGILVDHSASS